MLTSEKITYSIWDVYILMEEINYFKCIHSYEFKKISILNRIIEGQLYIENRIIPFRIDGTDIIYNDIYNTNLLIIDKYIFTIP